ncbi:AAC(3) family N-acetyltransferase [Psychromonas sp. Urea-02u-13]|uniref:AAC(3) family N-acetyltransferase n=1 Tax=Psychromonas sp. Urea-02u-13 TaxID=2058326 RepID=UPI000C329ADF|nr:AAC(3) family N-acetyltransferase [Psychromonas sp. Urea-02u-13]PKG39370.1 AAC(3) family N-acetyltransferase [Psychromonas sp. Urea-02u-13]
MVNKQQLDQSIKTLNLNNKVILLHSAYGSFGGVEGGPNCVIDCFLNAGCTLVVPTFTYDNGAYPPQKGLEYAQNGMDLTIYQDALQGLTQCFDKDSQQISDSMGVLSKVILARPESIRGLHPVNSFTAIGPQAKNIIEQQSLLDVYGPYQYCYELENASLLLMGIDFTGVTPIHYAEQKSGRTLFRAWANVKVKAKAKNSNDEKMPVEVSIGSCSAGFNALQPMVEHLVQKKLVGNSQWHCFEFTPFINRISKQIIATPEITHCDNAQCIRCHDAILGGPNLE